LTGRPSHALVQESVGTRTPFMMQNFSFAFAIFSDTRTTPLFPRWLAYVNIWAPIIFTPGAIPQFFKDGPFAWNGIFVFWIPATVFVIQFVVNVVYLLKAIKDEEVAEEPVPAIIGDR
jgi:hypothetical protein